MSSVLVLSSLLPAGLILMFASQRMEPSSILQSETAIYWRILRSFCRKSLASSGERISGSVTISIRGTPARLKSTRLKGEEIILPT